MLRAKAGAMSRERMLAAPTVAAAQQVAHLPLAPHTPAPPAVRSLSAPRTPATPTAPTAPPTAPTTTPAPFSLLDPPKRWSEDERGDFTAAWL